MEEPFEIVIRNVLDNRITIQPKASIGLTLQPTAGNVVNITKKDNVSVGLVNKANIAVTINTRAAQGGGAAVWGGITGTITNQTDLVEYVNRTVTSFNMESQDGSIFTIVVSNDGQLLVIPEGSTAPVITTLPTITGTEKVWYTLAAIAETLQDHQHLCVHGNGNAVQTGILGLTLLGLQRIRIRWRQQMRIII